MSEDEQFNQKPGGDRVSQALRAARRAANGGAGLTLQQVADATREVADVQPTLYSPMSRSMLSLMEGEGTVYFQRPVNAGKLRALIAVLFGRDHEEFRRQTGLSLTVQVAEEAPQLPPTLERARSASEAGRLAVYAEGQLQVERGDVRAQLRAGDYAEPEVPGLEFLFRVTSTRMAPIAFPGQLIGAVTCQNAEPGRVMIVRRGSEGLILAWSLPQGRYLQQAPGSEPFSLEAGDEVVGEVTHVRPFIPR